MSGENQMLGGCCICLDESGWKENALVYCDGTGCNVAVHQNCYGITKVPSGPWFCQKCASKEIDVKCCLCPKPGGALKKTQDERWAHVLCALYVPEIKFGNMTSMEPIIVSNIPSEVFHSHVCYICEEANNPSKQWGVCLLCAKPNCKIAFHVTCAQPFGLLTEEQVSSGTQKSVEYRGYCPSHVKITKIKDSPTYSHGKAENGSGAEDKKSMATPLTVEVTEKPKSRSRAKPQANNANKPKRVRKPAAKKNAAAIAKLSPQLKSPPLRSPLRSPGIRSPTLLSPGRSPISLVPTTSAQGLLEQQFELGKKMLEKQAPLDIAQLLNCISKIQQENQAMEAELQQLTSRRDNLVSINARLSLPINSTSVATTNASLPSLSNGPSSFPLNNGGAMARPYHPAIQGGAHLANQLPPLSLPTKSCSKDSPANRKQGGPSTNKDTSASQARKRQSDSVIKVNTKQSKPTPTMSPATNKPPAKAVNPQHAGADNSQFQWPTPLQRTTASSTSAPAAADSRLPTIDTLSQSRVATPQQLPSSNAYLNNPATMASYSVSNTAAMAANYAPYHQFQMFPMSGIADMTNLNPSALTGLAMQGLHNSQQYYRPAADTSTQNNKPN